MRRLIVGPFLEILIDGDIVGEDDGYARVGCRAVERDALSGFLASQPEVMPYSRSRAMPVSMPVFKARSPLIFLDRYPMHADYSINEIPTQCH